MRWGWPGLSEPYIFMCFSVVCRFKGLIPIWEAANALLWSLSRCTCSIPCASLRGAPQTPGRKEPEINLRTKKGLRESNLLSSEMRCGAFLRREKTWGHPKANGRGSIVGSKCNLCLLQTVPSLWKRHNKPCKEPGAVQECSSVSAAPQPCVCLHVSALVMAPKSPNGYKKAVFRLCFSP